MPAVTPRGYRYPLYTDPADFPTQSQNFATDVDTDVQALVNTANSALAAPSARVSASANQNIPANTLTFVTFAVEEYDNAAMGNLGVNNDRLTFTSTGIYLVEAQVNFAPNGNATVNGRSGEFVQNLSAFTARHSEPGIQTFATEWALSSLIKVSSVGDFVRVRVLQNSGAALNIDARSLSATKVSN
jgi:hypothetical protein